MTFLEHFLEFLKLCQFLNP